jgi:hypothetical protein
LNIAREHDHIIYWGTSGFSIRLAFPEKENLVSITYGYPPNIFQLLFGYLPWSEEEISALRKEIFNFKIFKETSYYLTVNVNNENMHIAEEAYHLMLQRVEASIKNEESNGA